MNILHLAHSVDVRSGWGRLAHEVITRLRQRGYTIDVLTEQPSEVAHERQILGRSWRALLPLREIRRYIKATQIIHSWEANPYAITAYLAGLGLHRKHVIVATGAYSVQPLYHTTTRAILKHVYRRADRILCISRYIEHEIRRVVPEARTEVVTLGVDFKKFSGLRRQPKERFILSVGNVGHRKGYHVSIPAFAEVARQIPDMKYYIAGTTDNDIFERLQGQIKKHNLENRVIFLGSQNDEQLKDLYLTAELFLLTSVNLHYHFEGFGLVFLEAASAGLPVIGTTNNGIADAVNEGKNGFLVPQDDPQATAEAILKLLKNPELKQQFSEESIAWARQNSWETTVDRYSAIYHQLLSST